MQSVEMSQTLKTEKIKDCICVFVCGFILCRFHSMCDRSASYLNYVNMYILIK